MADTVMGKGKEVYIVIDSANDEVYFITWLAESYDDLHSQLEENEVATLAEDDPNYYEVLAVFNVNVWEKTLKATLIGTVL